LAQRASGETAASLPAPPGEADIIASLAGVAAMLDEGHAPALVRARVDRVDGLIRAILPRLPDLGVGSADGYAVVATATDYLPETVGGYLRLPRGWADTRPIEGGRTALMVLVDQLELLAATMARMLDAAVHADAQALVAHGLFLESRFGTIASGGSLDVGAGAGTIPPPPPAVPAPETPAVPAPETPVVPARETQPGAGNPGVAPPVPPGPPNLLDLEP
jgi:hypothetical protein